MVLTASPSAQIIAFPGVSAAIARRRATADSTVYLALKHRHGGAVVALQVGSYWEFMFDDALTVSRALGLNLTSRNGIAMCGFALGSREAYEGQIALLGLDVVWVTLRSEHSDRPEPLPTFSILPVPAGVDGSRAAWRLFNFRRTKVALSLLSRRELGEGLLSAEAVALLALWPTRIRQAFAARFGFTLPKCKPCSVMPDDGYQPFAIIHHSWGYEQTNADFFRIVARKGDWITMQPLELLEQSDGAQSMTGRATPGAAVTAAATIRRRLRFGRGMPYGFAVHRGYGWAKLWSGRPVAVSHYA